MPSFSDNLKFGIAAPLFADDKKQSVDLKDFTDFNIGGVSGSKKDGTVNIGATDQRKDLVSGLGSTFSNQAGSIRDFLPQIDTAFNKFIGKVDNDLLSKVKPGFGALSSAQADAFGVARERLQNSRRARESNLKEDLSRRNISGSSFAQDTQTRTGAEFDVLDRELAAAEGQAKSRAVLEELDVTTQLIEKSHSANIQRLNSSFQATNDAFAAEAKSKGVALDDLNNIFQIGTSILNNTNAQAAQNSRFEAQAAMNEANAKAAQKSQIAGLLGGAAGFAVGGPMGASVGSAVGSAAVA